ncbi:MAG: hypothetical protein M3396_08930 [Actinomycetota bacterium]|nr:hypothetical protein [Actinomycetota bacterium]MDQ3573820.1 hypothetical protein [Actinomycetota bacterium]
MGAAVALLLVATALLVIGSGHDPARRASAGADIGDQSDTTALGRMLGTALRDARGPYSAGEPRTRCAPETRATYGQRLGPLVHSARLRWQGIAAVTLTYRVAGAGPAELDHRVFVVSADGCQLLVTQSLRVAEEPLPDPGPASR